MKTKQYESNMDYSIYKDKRNRQASNYTKNQQTNKLGRKQINEACRLKKNYNITIVLNLHILYEYIN